jgi:xeroderma pigmentosum group C-complementing protein
MLSYVLERHLKREEIILPKKEIGRFRGEPVFRRANVLSCKTAENWMRSGRRVRKGQEPLKWVKQRAVTLQKRRAQELSMQESGQAIQQGLYAENQTEVYRPPPIKDVRDQTCFMIRADQPGCYTAKLIRKHRLVRPDNVT